jgi:hypothetical protein
MIFLYIDNDYFCITKDVYMLMEHNDINILLLFFTRSSVSSPQLYQIVLVVETVHVYQSCSKNDDSLS